MMKTAASTAAADAAAAAAAVLANPMLQPKKPPAEPQPVLDISEEGGGAANRLDNKKVPLAFTSQKTGAGVELRDDGKCAASDGAAVGCQLADVWMAGGRKPLVWTCALVLEEVAEDTLIGVVGRNHWGKPWDAEAPLTSSTHAVVLRCGDGAVKHKGRSTSLKLRKLSSGARLNIIVDMQTLEMTVEVLGKDPSQVLSSVTIEGIPSGEIALAVGFAASGAAQRVRLVGCESEKPEMHLTGKFHKDLWDDDNVIKPLQLNALNRERGPNTAQQNEIATALLLET